ncbi:MAG: AhpC/TSA family protein [Mucilaginibacter polytrichastri]|nr:AhpC/TSA family protein [Mucilaginibacter polytrichastri]
MKKYLVALWLVLLACITGGLFWYNEYRYSLPTPLPAHYKAVQNGVRIPVDAYPGLRSGKPVLLHFFNPECPCSRFNITHVKQLMHDFSGKIEVAIVVVSKKSFSGEDIRAQFGLENVAVIADQGLSALCGVYSTPQAVILDKNRTLFYRGNYNRARYCTDAKTAYAQQAITDLLSSRPMSHLPAFATRAYGCSLNE